MHLPVAHITNADVEKDTVRFTLLPFRTFSFNEHQFPDFPILLSISEGWFCLFLSSELALKLKTVICILATFVFSPSFPDTFHSC